MNYGMNVRSGIKRRPVAPERRKRGRPLVDDKRRVILDAALLMFAERGYHGTAVPEVAAAARVGTGTLYRYFAHKEALVNEVYRDAKQRLRAALLSAPPPGPPEHGEAPGEAWFAELWRRLGVFARAEPAAFRFLEMQDHVAYLDAASREVELSVLAPLWLAGKQLVSTPTFGASGASKARAKLGTPAASAGEVTVDILIALAWGAFVGLIKAERLGYLRLDDAQLAQAGAAAWRMVAPAPPRARSPVRPGSSSRSTPRLSPRPSGRTTSRSKG